MKRMLLVLFFLVSAGELFSQAMDATFLHQLCKPLITITLGLYYFFSVPKQQRSFGVLLAVAFSNLGDSFLLYEHKNSFYFMAGLRAFLLAHGSYIVAYRQHRSVEFQNQLAGIQRIRLAFPVILAGTGLVVILYPHLGNLKFPVMLYAFILVVMVLTALYRFERTSISSFWMVFAGAMLFMVSDSILAINKFLTPVQYGGILIMLTYIGAQFLIVAGLIKHLAFHSLK
jgi:uncharacterized membrane protein YhhN